MKIKVFLACMALCSSVSAATVSGSIAYSFRGMSGVVPFSMSEGEEVVINDTFKVTPYVQSISRGKATASTIIEGGEFKLRINSLSKDSVMAAYTLKLNRLEDMRHVAGIDLPTSREVFNKGSKQAKTGERTNIFENEYAVVSIIVN
ncbi:hypothetical protein [Aeromonas salmonicida]|uniref:hypothetical protein n=1 Tax=Aeromonas salmonicida TaxID=645 RepID=UPI000B3FDE24|nr:hypothetical protein [Aeromonas salmonicida]ARW85358.1 hypothetical protein O23A_P3p0059 [Aeromonas salmonicida]